MGMVTPVLSAGTLFLVSDTGPGDVSSEPDYPSLIVRELPWGLEEETIPQG